MYDLPENLSIYLFDITAYCLCVHIIIRYRLIALSVIHIHESVYRTVYLVCFSVIHTLIAKGSVALLLAYDILTFVSHFP